MPGRLFLVLTLLTFTLQAFATCMSTCQETDGGQNPGLAGTTTVVTQCAAPGGPIHRTEQRFVDTCEDNIHTEFSCDGRPGSEWRMEVKYECVKCSQVLTGVCLEIGSVIQ